MMSLARLLNGIFEIPVGGEDLNIAGLCLDSRDIKPGDLFVALPGVQTDGRKFIPMAIEKGAVAVLAETGTQADIPVIETDQPAEALAKLAARFYPLQPETIIAITGTNGKSSTVEFLRQIWMLQGYQSAALGTLGVTRDTGRSDEGRTTPDAIALHRTLDQLAGEGVKHLAMEASSHGLKQHRMDGAHLCAAAFTNLTQDHFDYHPDFEDYFASKIRLFSQILPKSAPVVVVMDSPWSERVAEHVTSNGNRLITIGWRGHDLSVTEITPRPASQKLDFNWQGKAYSLELPLMGEFQAANALCAASLAIAVGMSADQAFAALEHLKGVAGRLQQVGTTQSGVPVLLDYAHTPDGLDKLLRAARPHTKGQIHLVFGAGGDRDPDKRPKMGAVAAKLADNIIITDDNPRSEDPAIIRSAIKAACPNAQDIADRNLAIRSALETVDPGDIVLIAGKGHETGQVFHDKTVPFDETEIVQRHLMELGK